MTLQEARKAAQEKRNALKADGREVGPAAIIFTWSKEVCEKFLLDGVWPVGPEAPAAPLSEIGKSILAELTPYLKAQVNAEEVKALIAEALSTFRAGAAAITVKCLTGEEVEVGRTHKVFEKVLKMVSTVEEGRRLNIWLAGPTGSGKSHLCSQVAKALPRFEGGVGVEFYPQPVGPQTTQSNILGYCDAHGKYISSPLYHAFKNGGLLLWDEWDSVNPAIGTCANAATSNGWMLFPNGEVVNRHPDFVLFTGCNTWGNGNDAEYVGRNKQDKALMSRFTRVAMEYDEALEVALYGDTPATRKVLAVRRKVFALHEKVICGTREIQKVNTLVKAGFDLEEAMEYSIWNGVNAEVKARCNA